MSGYASFASLSFGCWPFAVGGHTIAFCTTFISPVSSSLCSSLLLQVGCAGGGPDGGGWSPEADGRAGGGPDGGGWSPEADGVGSAGGVGGGVGGCAAGKCEVGAVVAVVVGANDAVCCFAADELASIFS